MSPVCPPWPWLDEDAQQAWREVIAEMERRGIEILAIDSTLLAGYCSSHARWAKHTRWLAEHDSEETGERSARVLSFVQAQERHVRKKIAQKAWDIATTCGAALFFLSPADRIRIHNIPSASIPRGRLTGGSAGRGGVKA